MTLADVVMNARVAVALLAGFYLVVVFIRRVRSDTDPSLRYSSETAGGSMSMLLSGTHVTMVLAGIIALATWPLVANSIGFAALLGGAVVAHYILEKGEDRRAAS